MPIQKQKINPEDDLGFGSQPVIKNQRLINQDGSVNVKRKGISIFNTVDNYHTLIKMSWEKFWLLVLGGYLLANLFFASLYLATGVEHLKGAEGNTPLGRFLDAFFFSAQTISTVGYGRISPSGTPTNIVAALESMTGLLSFALATGLLYGRFSRPSARIEWSNRMLVAPYLENGKGLMFRFANLRRNPLIDLEVEVTFSYNEDVNGKPVRRFFPLDLERKRVSLLTMNWTVVHPLDENSPIKELTADEMERTEAGFAVLLKAFDDTFSQTVHARTSYAANEIIWGAKFVPAFERDEIGRLVLNLRKIGEYEPYEFR
jgi:inward rectifier potassium channel